jgi:hypothetical protein
MSCNESNKENICVDDLFYGVAQTRAMIRKEINGDHEKINNNPTQNMSV